MWFMKSYGGLAHVRGISSSELARWTVGMVFMVRHVHVPAGAQIKARG
jgi:hypothetical protein